MTRNFAIYACPTAKNTTTESYTTKLLYKEKLSQQNAVHVGFAFLGVFFHSRESGMCKRYSDMRSKAYMSQINLQQGTTTDRGEQEEWKTKE